MDTRTIQRKPISKANHTEDQCPFVVNIDASSICCVLDDGHDGDHELHFTNDYPRKTTAADPAQSAPSAEPLTEFVKFYHDIWDGAMTDLFGAAEAYAALRTAQLERELQQARLNAASHQHSAQSYEAQLNQAEFDLKLVIERKDELRTRAETAESALREIVGNVDLKQLLEWLEFELSGSPGDGMLSDCKEIISRVAAQTPAQVKNPGAGEKEER